MVGDRLDTDIQFGKDGGLSTLLVLSGGFRAGWFQVHRYINYMLPGIDHRTACQNRPGSWGQAQSWLIVDALTHEKSPARQ